MSKIKVFEGFCGYGGAHYGLKRSGVDFEVVGFSEVDKYAIELYNLNFPTIKNYGDITNLEVDNIDDFDLFCGGFPCQPFSTAGLGLGELDIRGTLFYDIVRIVEHKKPKYILLENVKGLTSKRHKPTFDKIINEFKDLGYKVFHKVLNTKDYGIPQNRERLWIFATLDTKFDDTFTIEPPKIELKKRIKDFLDKKVDGSLYKSKKQIERLIEIHNVDFNVSEPLCFDVYNKKIKKDGICITITEPHHNSLRIVEPKLNNEFRVRKASVTEQFRLMGFKNNEVKFGEQSYSQLSKRCGNGWDINLVTLILKKIFKTANLI
ncbi:DNA cytosine methyltransferase [Flavobacteriaceae bacterium]|nr:DNA cytosine methyltransferase [Flavobacteriaceae bacterium]|tara:strand:- start:1181 stop:2140 length:960 start_codon:yes stop_codon:yes gene_type:complete